MFLKPQPRKSQNSFFQKNMALQGLRRGFVSMHDKNPALGNLVQEEKDVISALNQVVKEMGEAASYLQKWGEGEHYDLKVYST